MIDDQNPDEQNKEFVISEQELGQLPQELLGSAGLAPIPEAGEMGVPTPSGEAPPADPILADPALASPDQPDPNENPDPALAVEEMLSAAVPAEAPVSTIDLAPADVPGFRVTAAIPEAKREAFKAFFPALGLDPAHAEAGAFSRLTEFQAARLVRELRSHGVLTHVEVSRPEFAASEDDLALGGLLAVPDPLPLVSEGAPSVALPAHEKDVLLVTAEALPGFHVVETRGIVSAHRSIARRFFREQELQDKMEREMQRYPGRSASILPKSSMDKLFRELFLDLQKGALALGANAVVSLRIDSFPETVHLDPGFEQMRLVALGTAAVVEKSS